jgi:GTP-binding protein EngB required for normal cell division
MTMTKKSLLIIGNSNVGKTSITKLLLPNPRKFKGKSGKHPGSTLLIRTISQDDMPYQIVDLPGFGFMTKSSHRREEHIKNQVVLHVEKNYQNYFLSLIVINVLRIEDELNKYFIQNKKTIPLSFELINFINELGIPSLVIFNKVDKVSNYDMKESITLFLKHAKEYGLNLIHLDDYESKNGPSVPYLEFSALKKINLNKLLKFITFSFNEAKLLN